MSFPACRHAKRKPLKFSNRLIWIGSEPYRVFFLSGILFSIAGVLMWPLFYKGLMSFYPGVSHARVMIQAFAGAFVVGFLGTAGPRILSAPRLNPQWLVTANMHRLAGLLLYQGFLVGPVMGVGIFLFPRLLENAFGGPEPGVETRKSWRNMSLTALVLVTSFGVEVWVNPNAGLLLRVAAFGFALSNVKWLSKPGAPQVGTLANALRIWCLPLALAGLIAPVFFHSRHIAVDHLLFISGFGLVCLIAGS